MLTLEGGYTKEAVVDGMHGVLEGLVELARSRAKTRYGCAVKDPVKRKMSSFADCASGAKPAKRFRSNIWGRASRNSASSHMRRLGC